MMVEDTDPPLNYYTAYHQIAKQLPRDCMIISEGANTMDISRSMIPNHFPRHRLDAGSFGTMGVGLGFAVAAAIWCRDHAPEKRVVCIQGDSAFGFSGMELETVCRYKLPIVFVIFNNNGVFSGLDETSWNSLTEDEDPTLSSPPNCLLPDARYDKILSAFGGNGFFVQTTDDLEQSMRRALREKLKPSMINIKISPFAQRKAQEHSWLTTSKL